MKPTDRFTPHADAYAKHRPGYPRELIAWLAQVVPPGARSSVADVGAGTGIFTRALVDSGYDVIAVEPNPPMRAAALTTLAGTSARVVDGSGEATGLPSGSIELVTIAQALHWLDLERARAELARILVPGGKVAVIYNSRRTDAGGFSQAIEAAFARYAPAREGVGHLGSARTEKIETFFRGAPSPIRHAAFDHVQRLDWNGVLGWLNSISYLPLPEAPARRELESTLRTAFVDAASADGTVEIAYVATVDLGELRPS